MPGGARVGLDAWSMLIYAGWLPQDGLFGGSVSAGLEVERGGLWPLLIVLPRVAPHAAATRSPAGRSVGPSQSGRVASDQYQPASSRAMATFATTGRLWQAVKVFQRWLSR